MGSTVIAEGRPADSAMLRFHALKSLPRLVLAVRPHAAARVAAAQVDAQWARLPAAGCGAHQHPLAVQPALKGSLTVRPRLRVCVRVTFKGKVRSKIGS